MKVKCIYNKGLKKWLAIGKFYEVISENDYCYTIIDDKGEEDWYPKKVFKPLLEIRNWKIDKILEE